MRYQRTWILGLMPVMLALLMASLGAQTGQMLSFTGNATLADGAYNLTFNFYDQDPGGALLYTENQTGINITGGTFSVILGPAPASAFNSATGSVYVATEETGIVGEIGTRVPIYSSGFAHYAQAAANAQTATTATTATTASTASTLNPGASVSASQPGSILSIANTNPTGEGLFASGKNGVHGQSASGSNSGIWGENTGGGTGVSGSTNSTAASFIAGVWGDNSGTGVGVKGTSANGLGVFGWSTANWGVRGDSVNNDGTAGLASASGKSGVFGRNDHANGNGVSGYSLNGYGVWGRSNGGGARAGVYGLADNTNGNGIIGEANNGSSAYGVWGKSTSGYAGYFDGKVQVNGAMTARIVQITGADFSEKFEVRSAQSSIDPGMVVVIDPDNPGKLVVSEKAYDRRVAGILSGAGGINPGMLMGQPGTLADGDRPVALSGRVYVWADASHRPIVPGDLLTTSHVPGHAMKVTNYGKAPGATIGKAMTGLAKGRGLVLVLVTLQ